MDNRIDNARNEYNDLTPDTEGVIPDYFDKVAEISDKYELSNSEMWAMMFGYL